MRRISVIHYILCSIAPLLLAGCSLYQKYEPVKTVPNDIMGDAADSLVLVVPTDSLRLAIDTISWRVLFTDVLLQQLIDRALANNTNLQQAELTVEQAQNDLYAAQLGYLPTLSFDPSGGVRHFNGETLGLLALPLKASWQVSIFGQVNSRKRQASAKRAMYKDYRLAVQASLVANVASTYYRLLMLDRQLEISLQTEKLWQESLESAVALFEAGLYQSPAVWQMKASLEEIRISITDLREDILITESALCLLLSETPHHIARATWDEFRIPSSLHVGVPLRLLSARPDVRQAQRKMEAAFYETQQAHQSFYPNITISGTLGWSNDNGVVNPAKMLTEALASLTQPLFAGGKIRARYRNAQLEQQKARLEFEQTLLRAGNEIYQHLHAFKKSQERVQHIAEQVLALNEAREATYELMNNGTNTYLEVVASTMSLHSAQISEVKNRYDAILALINLYTALGGFQR